jgi:tetratricopeptide (TPR) repeat protein
MPEISDGLLARGDGKTLRHRAMTEAGNLRENEPHPVALLPTTAQFVENTRIDRRLRVEEAPEAERAEETGDPEKAIELYSRAKQLRPRSMAPRMRLAVLYLSEDRIDNAIEAAGEVVKARPKDPWGYAIQGLAHVVVGDVDRAEAAFESALRVDPDYGLAISELGEIKEEKGEREEAIRLFERGLRLDGLADGARAVYARILKEEDRRSDAEDLLRAVADDEERVRSRRVYSALFAYELGAVAAFAVRPTTVLFVYLGLHVLQCLLVRLAAANSGKRFVTTVLAESSVTAPKQKRGATP